MLMLRLGNSFDCSMQPDVSATHSRGGTSVLSFKINSLLYPYVFSEVIVEGLIPIALGWCTWHQLLFISSSLFPLL